MKMYDFHPRVHVALHRNRKFGPREDFHDCGRSGWLRFIPFAIVFRNGVNVVCGLIVVIHLELLASHHGDHMRRVHAALLIDGRGGGRNRERVLAHIVRNKHNDVCQACRPAPVTTSCSFIGVGCCDSAIRFSGHVNFVGARAAPSSLIVPLIEPAVDASTGVPGGAAVLAVSAGCSSFFPQLTKTRPDAAASRTNPAIAKFHVLKNPPIL